MAGRDGSLYEAFDIIEDLQSTIRYCKTKDFQEQLYLCMENIIKRAKEIAQDGDENSVDTVSGYVPE